MPNHSDALNANTTQNKNKRLDLRCLENLILKALTLLGFLLYLDGVL
jgi:hypothetical protein